jgi:hypothetical protein
MTEEIYDNWRVEMGTLMLEVRAAMVWHTMVGDDSETGNNKGNPRKIMVWQRSFHDHVIRDQAGYKKICLYIEGNPMNWEKDCFYAGQSDI